MKNKQGFTLVELLAVLVIISLLMVLVVPQVQKISYNSKIKLCNTKIDLTINALNTWSENNPNCFTNETGCNILSNCTTTDNKTTCETTFDLIAQKGIISYDEDNNVINPITNKGMNNHEITVTYNQSNKTANTQINTTNICSKNIEDIYVDPENKTTTTTRTTTTSTTTTKPTTTTTTTTKPTTTTTTTTKPTTTTTTTTKKTTTTTTTTTKKTTTTTKKIVVTDNLLTTYIKAQYNNNDGVIKDDYNNLRYVGEDPNNYITFNNESYRIIGIFDEGIKIIRETKIGSGSWASNGLNNWVESSLNEKLNETYYNTLSTTSKSQIQEVTWHLGGWSTSKVSAKEMYQYERGSTVYTGRPTEWTGNIALIYPSDYGYASNAEACLNNLNQCYASKDVNWLFNDSGIWSITPYSENDNSVFYVFGSGTVSNSSSPVNYYSVGFRPTLYLKSNIKITSGTGTSASPFQVSL